MVRQGHEEREQTPKAPEVNGAVVSGIVEEYIKNPPNNLGLAHPEEQSRTNDLIGVEGTEVARDPPDEAELARIQKVVEELEKRGTL